MSYLTWSGYTFLQTTKQTFRIGDYQARGHELLASRSSSNHVRSLSANPSPLRKSVTRSGSTPQLPTAIVADTVSALPNSRFDGDVENLRTLRDPRSPTDEFPSPRGSASPSPHPDLSIEVATLSNKLISAINHQTHLDDALAATRQELDSAQERIRQLEAVNQEHTRLVASGGLLEKAEVELQASKLLAKIQEERKRRTSVEKDKKGIEQELENLTTALFEEANEVCSLDTALDFTDIIVRWSRPPAKSVKPPKDAMTSFVLRLRIQSCYLLHIRNS